MTFLSTPSGWRATICFENAGTGFSNFYPRPPGGGRRGPCAQGPRSGLYFYPRPPGGGRQLSRDCYHCAFAFLSTPSGWRATYFLGKGGYAYIEFLSTPSGWRATATERKRRWRSGFLSTPSGWRATRKTSKSVPERTNFYPRPPGGGRLTLCKSMRYATPFLSTPSGWRATSSILSSRSTNSISIHALRVEGDALGYGRSLCARKFLSTPSGWRATRMAVSSACSGYYFYPRPPGGGRPLTLNKELINRYISIHALRVEGDD